MLVNWRTSEFTLERPAQVQPSSMPPKVRRKGFSRLMIMHANHREDVEVVRAGDIAAAVRFQRRGTGDTLCDEKNALILESMEFRNLLYLYAWAKDQDR